MNFSTSGNEANRIIRQMNEKLHTFDKLLEQSAHDHGNMKGRQTAYAATFMGMINTYIGLALNGYILLDQKLIDRGIASIYARYFLIKSDLTKKNFKYFVYLTVGIE